VRAGEVAQAVPDEATPRIQVTTCRASPATGDVHDAAQADTAPQVHAEEAGCAERCIPDEPAEIFAFVYGTARTDLDGLGDLTIEEELDWRCPACRCRGSP
jgi:hypothetical protein